MTHSDKNILSMRGWLSRQPKPFRDAVYEGGQARRYGRGAAIYLQGDAPGGIYGIVDGAVAITIAPGSTGPHLGHVAAPGEWFGEGAFLTGEPRRIGLEAATDATLLLLPLEAMERMAAADPMNVRRFGQIAMLNIDLTLRVIDDLLIPEADRRVAAALSRLVGGRDGCAVHLSQAELGLVANASRKVVNGALGRFADRGWVIRGYSAVEVVDARGLRAFTDGEPT